MKQIVLFASLVFASACSADSIRDTSATRALAYPETRRMEHVDVYHGQRIADPYRWFEDENAAETRQWIEAENALAQPYLEAIPARAKIKERLTQLWNYERYDIPVKRGGRYFYLRNDGLQNQSVLYVADSLDATPRVLHRSERAQQGCNDRAR